MNTPSLQRGFCVTPLYEILYIMAVLGIAAFVLFPRIQENKRGVAEAGHAQAIAGNLRKELPSGNYTSLNTNWAKQKGIFPERMQQREGRAEIAIRSQWGEPVSVVASGPSGFAVVYHNTPPRACRQMVRLAGNTFNRVEVIPQGGEAVSMKKGAILVDEDLVKTVCSSADTASVVFSGE